MDEQRFTVAVSIEDEAGDVRTWAAEAENYEEAMCWLRRRAAFELFRLDCAARWPDRVGPRPSV